jgi:hypothetical protein
MPPESGGIVVSGTARAVTKVFTKFLPKNLNVALGQGHIIIFFEK